MRTLRCAGSCWLLLCRQERLLSCWARAKVPFCELSQSSVGGPAQGRRGKGRRSRSRGVARAHVVGPLEDGEGLGRGPLRRVRLKPA